MLFLNFLNKKYCVLQKSLKLLYDIFVHASDNSEQEVTKKKTRIQMHKSFYNKYNFNKELEN